MKTTLLLIGIFGCLASACADELGINIELTPTKRGQIVETLVTIHAGYLTNYDRVNIPVKAAAEDLRNISFNFDGKFAVIHSGYPIPLADLMPIFEAMSANNIQPFYIQIGLGPPTGMDIWNSHPPASAIPKVK